MTGVNDSSPYEALMLTFNRDELCGRRYEIGIVYLNDETLEIHVNGHVIPGAGAHHAVHGWSGMDAVARSVIAVIIAIGGYVDDQVRLIIEDKE